MDGSHHTGVEYTPTGADDTINCGCNQNQNRDVLQAAPLLSLLHQAQIRAVPRARLRKQTTAALLSLLERESLLTLSCRPFELLEGCPKTPERLRRTSDNLLRKSGELNELAN